MIIVMSIFPPFSPPPFAWNVCKCAAKMSKTKKNFSYVHIFDMIWEEVKNLLLIISDFKSGRVTNNNEKLSIRRGTKEKQGVEIKPKNYCYFSCCNGNLCTTTFLAPPFLNFFRLECCLWTKTGGKRRRSRIYSRDKLPENRKSGGVRASALTKPKRDLLQ